MIEGAQITHPLYIRDLYLVLITRKLFLLSMIAPFNIKEKNSIFAI